MPTGNSSHGWTLDRKHRYLSHIRGSPGIVSPDSQTACRSGAKQRWPRGRCLTSSLVPCTRLRANCIRGTRGTTPPSARGMPPRGSSAAANVRSWVTAATLECGLRWTLDRARTTASLPCRGLNFDIERALELSGWFHVYAGFGHTTNT